MKITYFQRSPACPIYTSVGGYPFIAGAETDVSDPVIIEMLSRSAWFRVEGAKLKGEFELQIEPSLQVPQAEFVTPETVVVNDSVDDDGESVDRNRIITDLKNLGEKVDGRMSTDKLKAQLDAVTGQ